MFSHCFLSMGILRNLLLIALRYHKDDQISKINMVTVKTVEPSAGLVDSVNICLFLSSRQADKTWRMF